MASSDAKAELQSALAVKQYGLSCKSLFGWGRKYLAAQSPIAAHVALLEALGEGTNEVLAALTAARGAATAGQEPVLSALAAKHLTHSSSRVRRAAACGGLLTAQDARKAMLSPGTTSSTRSMLVRHCHTLPLDDETINCDDLKDNEKVHLIVKSKTEKQVLEFADLEMKSMTDANAERIAKRFPQAALKLCQDKPQHAGYCTMIAVAQQEPEAALRLAVCEKERRKKERKKETNASIKSEVPEVVVHKLVKWAWNKHFNLILDLCVNGTLQSRFTPFQLLSLCGENATFAARLQAVWAVFAKAGGTGSHQDVVNYFNLLPSIDNINRTEDIKALLKVFWDMMASSGLKWDPWTHFKLLQPRLPAVSYATAFLESTAAARARRRQPAITDSFANLHVYIMKRSSKPPLPDTVRLQVLQSLLGSNKANVACLELFREFTSRVRTAHFLQRGLNAFAKALRGRVPRRDLSQVVHNMAALEEAEMLKARSRGEEPSERLRDLSSLPLDWITLLPFVESKGHDATLPPIAQMLRCTLLGLRSPEGSPSELLTSLCGQFGRPLFWALFTNVLQGVEADVLLNQAGNKPYSNSDDQHVKILLSQLTMLRPGSSATTGTASSSSSSSSSSNRDDDEDGLPEWLLVSADGDDAVEEEESKENDVDSKEVDPLAHRANSEYFEKRDAIVARTSGSDHSKREAAYINLIRSAGTDFAHGSPQLVADVFDDMVSYLTQRMEREQETIKFSVFPELLRRSQIPAAMWVSRGSQHLISLWNTCEKARSCKRNLGNWRHSFDRLANELMDVVLDDWEGSPEAARAIVATIADYTKGNANENMFWKHLKKRAAVRFSNLSSAALEWLLDGVVRCGDDSAVGGKGGRGGAPAVLRVIDVLRNFYGQSFQEVCEKVPSLLRRWEEELGVISSGKSNRKQAQRLLSFVMSGALEVIGDAQGHMSRPQDFRLLQAPAYTKALNYSLQVLTQLSVVGPVEAIRISVSRLRKLEQYQCCLPDGFYTKASVEATVAVCTAALKAAPESLVRECSSAANQVAEFVNLYDVANEGAITVLDAAMNRLDYNHEARLIIACHADSELTQRTHGGVVLAQNLLDNRLSLSTPEQADELAEKLAARKDGAAMLFFGSEFSDHLAFRRQDILHDLLSQLEPAPPADAGKDGFAFHHHLCTNTPPDALVPLHCWDMLEGGARGLLHVDTQRLLAQHLQRTTTIDALTALARLEKVDCTDHVLAVLAASPREQTEPEEDDDEQDGAAAAADRAFRSHDFGSVVNHRYATLPLPLPADAVGKKHVDEVVLVYGHCDHSARALKVLGEYAGYHKLARDALKLIIRSMSRPGARKLIKDILVAGNNSDNGKEGKKVGLSTTVHMLREALALEMDDPLELCELAHRGGQCHRDVLASMLYELIAMRADAMDKADVPRARPFFNLAHLDAETSAYVAGTVVDRVVSSYRSTGINKHLSFLPEVLSEEWAHVAPSPSQVFRALASCSQWPTESCRAVASMMANFRVLGDVSLHRSNNIASRWTRNEYTVNHTLSTFGVAKPWCDYATLRSMVQEWFKTKPTRSEDHNWRYRAWTGLLRDNNLAATEEAVSWILQQIRADPDKPASDLRGLACKAATSCSERKDNAVHRCHASTLRAVQAVRASVPEDECDEDARLGGKGESAKLLIKFEAKLVAATGTEQQLEALLVEAKDWDWHKRLELAQQMLGPNSAHYARVLEWAVSKPFPFASQSERASARATNAFLTMCIEAFHTHSVPISTVLSLFQRYHSTSRICVDLIRKMCESKAVDADLTRECLTWLAELFPSDAAEMYPSLLRREPTQAADVVALLSLATQHSVRLPVLPQSAVLVGMGLLLASPLVEARVQAARLLSDPDGPCGEDASKQLRHLVEGDKSIAVRTVARAGEEELARAKEHSNNNVRGV